MPFYHLKSTEISVNTEISAWCQHVYYYLDKRGNIELVADYGKEHGILQQGQGGVPCPCC